MTESSRAASNGRDLPVFQLDRSRAAENVNHHGHATVRLIDAINVPFEVLERTLVDLYAIAGLECDLELESREFNPATMQALFDLGYRQAKDGYDWMDAPPFLDPDEIFDKK